MDVKKFFDKAKEICDTNLGYCTECPLTSFCCDGIFSGTSKEIDKLIQVVKKSEGRHE